MSSINEDNKPVNIGVDNIDENIEKILSKPPGHRIYDGIKVNKVEERIEESFAKLRLKKINVDKAVDIVAPVTDVNNVDEESDKLFSLRNMKATDMKCNKRVFFSKFK